MTEESCNLISQDDLTDATYVNVYKLLFSTSLYPSNYSETPGKFYIIWV